MKSQPQLLLIIGAESGFIEIYQKGYDYMFNSDGTTLKKFLSDEDTKYIKFKNQESFSSLEAALLRINIKALRRCIITYIEPDYEFDIILLLYQLMKKLLVFINKKDNNTEALAKNYYLKGCYELAL